MFLGYGLYLILLDTSYTRKWASKTKDWPEFEEQVRKWQAEKEKESK